MQCNSVRAMCACTVRVRVRVRCMCACMCVRVHVCTCAHVCVYLRGVCMLESTLCFTPAALLRRGGWVWAAGKQGSQAYAKALGKSGILTQDEAATIVEGLSKVGEGVGGGGPLGRQAGGRQAGRHNNCMALGCLVVVGCRGMCMWWPTWRPVRRV